MSCLPRFALRLLEEFERAWLVPQVKLDLQKRSEMCLRQVKPARQAQLQVDGSFEPFVTPGYLVPKTTLAGSWSFRFDFDCFVRKSREQEISQLNLPFNC
jgi:hypothetical protein